MGCDIHLRLERRLKSKVLPNGDVAPWYNCHFWSGVDTWGSQDYGMFSRLANVRNYNNVSHLDPKGFPTDASIQVVECYVYAINQVEKFDDDTRDCMFEERIVDKSTARNWVNNHYSKYYRITAEGLEETDEANAVFVSDPDNHSASWCTADELEKALDDYEIEHKYRNIDYEALLGTMLGYEHSGNYECRAVFWFDK